jgi:3-oxoacyl-[acyl-carrier-protein] synthase-3
MALTTTGLWPQYTYIIPDIYTKAKMRLVGLGMYAPRGLITNDFFAAISTSLGSPRSAKDLERATGLETRRVRASTLNLCRQIVGADAPGLIDDPEAPAEESLVDMAVIAAQRALASAGRDASEIDTILAASSSDNEAFPTIAGLVQLRLGCRPVRASTLKGACACDTEIFQMAAEVLAASTARLVLIIAAESLLANATHLLDWKTSSLFGEGASAFLLERSDSEEDETYIINGYDARHAAILCYQTPLRTEAAAMAAIDHEILHMYQKGRMEEVNRLLAQYMVGYMSMNGKRVYREAPRAMAECVDVLCRHAQLAPDDLTHIIAHQANSRILQRVGEVLVSEYQWPASTSTKIADHFRYYGNLSNASIGMALVESLRKGNLHEGDWLAMPAAGGGMHYGSWLVRYHGLKHVEEAIRDA